MDLAMRESIKKHCNLSSMKTQQTLIRKYVQRYEKNTDAHNLWYKFLAEEFFGIETTVEKY